MTIAEVLKEVQEDINNKPDNPSKRLETNSDRALKYSEYLFRMTRIYNLQRVLLQTKYSEIYKKMKYDTAFLLKSRNEAENFINTDEQYIKLKKETDEYENIVKLLSNLVDIYKQREASERMIFKYTTGVS